MAEPVQTPIVKGDPRVYLQTEIGELSAALQEWRQTRKYSQQTEERLAQITVQCARMVETWQQMDRRRIGSAPGRDERSAEWGGIDRRRQQDTGERIRTLERTIENEWDALSDGSEDAARPLSEPPASLTNTSADAANLALRGLASAEARLAAIEQDLQTRMAQLSRDLQAVAAELRGTRQQPSSGTPSAFPLESVMRIHDELRESDAPSASDVQSLTPGAARALPQLTESATALTARVESLERAVGSGAVVAPQPVSGWRPRYAVVGLLVALAAMTFFALWMDRRVDERLNEAASLVTAAERERDEATAATREEAARQVAHARQSAAQAQIVGNVLAAPDRVRYWLGGVGANSRAYAQVLFSRSRGLVFSASRLQPPGDGRTYQLWLLTTGGPVSAGPITADSSGRAALATDTPPAVRRLRGALVTLEPEGGSAQPSNTRVLIRIE